MTVVGRRQAGSRAASCAQGSPGARLKSEATTQASGFRHAVASAVSTASALELTVDDAILLQDSNRLPAASGLSARSGTPFASRGRRGAWRDSVTDLAG